MKKLLTVLAFLILVAQVHAQLPRIIILATGGTIAGAGAASDRAGYTAGKIPIDDLIGSIPTVKKVANITGEQIASVGSQDMTIEIWKKLAIRINEIFKNNEADGIVITHGTDTMTDTAKALAEKINNKTIVLTGAMIPYKFGSSDGLFNLGSALAFVQTLPNDVYIAMNGKYFTWNNVRKNKQTGEFEELVKL